MGINVPTLTTELTRQQEHLLEATFGLSQLQVQENGGRAAAEVTRALLDDDIADRPIVVLAGRGNNGAVGMVAARHLLNWGADVQVLCSYGAQDYTGVPAQQLQILQFMGAPMAWAEEGWELPPCDLVIDAIIGYGLRGDPRGRAWDLIQLANSTVVPILSIETPSGLDTERGQIFAPCVQAAATLALGLPQRGLLVPTAAKIRGDLYLADVGIPGALYADLGVEADSPLFAHSTWVPLVVDDQGHAFLEVE